MKLAVWPGRNKRRRAVAGLFMAVLIFGLIFTVGIDYFLFESQLSLTSSQAAANRQAAYAAATREGLSLSVRLVTSGPHSGWLYAEVYNSGGVASVVTAIFVTSTSGQILSKSTNSPYSQYLVGQPDLNVTLPLSLGLGFNTTSMGGCASGAGCNIGINTAAFRYTSGTVLVDVITAYGNVFSEAYPPPPAVTTTTSTKTEGTLTATSTSYTTSTSITTTTFTASSSVTIGYGFGIGTNSLIVSMKACAGTAGTTGCSGASNVYQGGEVVLQVNVTNYAGVSMQTYVNFQSVGFNGVSVTNSAPNSCTGGVTSTVTIPADTGTASTATYYCTFTANAGSTGGSITFFGYAVGQYTISPAPAATVTSAEATSNTLLVGNLASNVLGPWALNYFYYNYASYENHNWRPAEEFSAGSNYDVIYQLQVTNTANASLTILQYTYFEYANFNEQEMDFYLVAPVTTYTTSISAYGCTSTGTGGAPTGSSCTTAQTNCTVLGNGCVPVGSTITLSFAACAPDGSSFMWARTGGGNSACSSNGAAFNPTEGEVGFVVIIYDYYSGGQWHLLAQTLPALSSYVSS